MTAHHSRILDACTGEWQSAQRIANKLGPEYDGRTLVPRLMQLELNGHLERNWDQKYHRWRIK